MKRSGISAVAGVRLASVLVVVSSSLHAQSQRLRTGDDALRDWSTDAPGVRRKITDLPAPNSRESVTNGPHVITRPRDAELQVPAGFKVEQVASGLRDLQLARGRAKRESCKVGARPPQISTDNQCYSG